MWSLHVQIALSAYVTHWLVLWSSLFQLHAEKAAKMIGGGGRISDTIGRRVFQSRSDWLAENVHGIPPDSWSGRTTNEVCRCWRRLETRWCDLLLCSRASLATGPLFSHELHWSLELVAFNAPVRFSRAERILLHMQGGQGSCCVLGGKSLQDHLEQSQEGEETVSVRVAEGGGELATERKKMKGKQKKSRKILHEDWNVCFGMNKKEGGEVWGGTLRTKRGELRRNWCCSAGMRWKCRRLNCSGLWRAGGVARRQERLWAGREEVWLTGEEFNVSLFRKSWGRGSRAAEETDRQRAWQHGCELSLGEGRTETSQCRWSHCGGQRSEGDFLWCDDATLG